MILLELVEWAWEHKGEITLNALLLLILRKFVMSEVHKILHLGRDKEITWLLQRVETLSGEKFNSQPDFLRTVRTRYIKSYYSFFVPVIRRVNQSRRKTKMNQNISWITLVPALFGAIKLILQPFHIDLSYITDTQINDMANGIAALFVVGGIIYNHVKKPQTIVSDPNKFIQP